ncbi:MAG: glycosyltransferase family 39 protein [Acidobacteriota bacterium]|nr:glycosyltransferase family 39 protein [Acidobacteriota bacterium]
MKRSAPQALPQTPPELTATTRAVAAIMGSDSGLALFIFMLALVIRLAHYDQLVQADFLKYPTHAAHFMSGEGEATRPFTCSPLYLYFWVGVGKVLGGSLEAGRWVQIIIGCGSCALIALLGRGLFSPAAGVVAGVASALYLPFMAHDASFVSEPLVMFLNLLSIWSFHRARLGARLGLPAGAVALGLSAAARPNGLLLLPFFVAWGLGFGDREAATQHRRIPLFALLCLLALLPPGLVTVRNSRMAGDFVPVMSDGGIVAYIGNNGMNSGFMYAWPRYEDLYLTKPGEVDPTHRIAHEIAEKELGRRLSVTEASAFWTRQATRFVREHPARFVCLLVRKIGYNWTGYEAHDVASCFDREDALRGRPYLLRFTLVGAVGLVGAGWFIRRFATLLPLYALIGAYTLTAALFTVVARYRIPMIPALILLGAGFAVDAWQLVRSGETRRLRFSLLCLLALLLAMGYRNYPMRALDAQYRVERESLSPAEGALKAGKLDKARGLLEQTIAANSTFMTTCRAHGLLAVLEKVLGEDEESRIHALVGRGWAFGQQDPEILVPPPQLSDDPLAEMWLRACQELEAGNASHACREFLDLTRMVHNLVPLRYNLGLSLIRSGDIGAGLYELRLARMKDPSCLPVHRLIVESCPRAQRDHLVSEYAELAEKHTTQLGFRYGYALALDAAGQSVEAAKQMRKAQEMPNFADLLPPQEAP